MWNHHLCHIHLHHHNYQYRCHNQRRYLLGFTRHRHHRNQQYRSIGCITLSSPLSSGRYEDCFVCVLVGVVLQGACVGLGCVLARRENENYGCSCWGVSCCNTGFMAWWEKQLASASSLSSSSSSPDGLLHSKKNEVLIKLLKIYVYFIHDWKSFYWKVTANHHDWKRFYWKVTANC